MFAHTAIERNRNNPARYGDAEDLLEVTAQFVARLNSAIRSLHCTYEEHKLTCKEDAEFFWHLLLGKDREELTIESNGG